MLNASVFRLLCIILGSDGRLEIVISRQLSKRITLISTTLRGKSVNVFARDCKTDRPSTDYQVKTDYALLVKTKFLVGLFKNKLNKTQYRQYNTYLSLNSRLFNLTNYPKCILVETRLVQALGIIKLVVLFIWDQCHQPLVAVGCIHKVLCMEVAVGEQREASSRLQEITHRSRQSFANKIMSTNNTV